MRILESETRKNHFEKYIHYSDDLKKLLGGPELKQWVNGSFVTRKKDPKDIDLVTFVDHAIITKMSDKLDGFTAGGSWVAYEVDAYLLEVYPEESKFYRFTRSDMAYWYARFSQTRFNRRGNKYPKGFLEILY